MIELKTQRKELCYGGHDRLQDDRQNHDCLAAHAYQQAVEEVADEMDNRIAPLINTRAAEILAQWMRGE